MRAKFMIKYGSLEQQIVLTSDSVSQELRRGVAWKSCLRSSYDAVSKLLAGSATVCGLGGHLPSLVIWVGAALVATRCLSQTLVPYHMGLFIALFSAGCYSKHHRLNDKDQISTSHSSGSQKSLGASIARVWNNHLRGCKSCLLTW